MVIGLSSFIRSNAAGQSSCKKQSHVPAILSYSGHKYPEFANKRVHSGKLIAVDLPKCRFILYQQFTAGARVFLGGDAIPNVGFLQLLQCVDDGIQIRQAVIFFPLSGILVQFHFFVQFRSVIYNSCKL